MWISKLASRPVHGSASLLTTFTLQLLVGGASLWRKALTAERSIQPFVSLRFLCSRLRGRANGESGDPRCPSFPNAVWQIATEAPCGRSSHFHYQGSEHPDQSCTSLSANNLNNPSRYRSTRGHKSFERVKKSLGTRSWFHAWGNCQL